MPEDSKKHQHKAKQEAKEQRKPRQARQQAASEKKIEKKAEQPKIPAPKPVYEDPGPEFYNSLKRETDEILKITEEANSKYKKKEIQSNWSKYEMPIESYEEIQEQENLGADYEKLVQAPQSIGGHFQFKHEKTWDISTAPSLYDKYFEINMENLATALSTIPFYERNNMDKSIFSQIDILSMENRATRYKQKYYNDKSYTTPELDAQDKIINICLKDNISSSEKNENSDDIHVKKTTESKDIVFEDNKNISRIEEVSKSDNISNVTSEMKETDSKLTESDIIERTTVEAKKTDNVEDQILTAPESNIIEDTDDVIIGNVGTSDLSASVNIENEIKLTPEKKETHKVADTSGKETKKAVIESPEDLEKWLDDFLDG